MEERISTLAAEIQETRELAMQQQLKDEETIRNLWSLIYSLQSIVTTSQLKMEQASEEKEKVVILSRLSVNKVRIKVTLTSLLLPYGHLYTRI